MASQNTETPGRPADWLVDKGLAMHGKGRISARKEAQECWKKSEMMELNDDAKTKIVQVTIL